VRDPLELLEFLSEPELGGPVLIEALDGFMDAGHGAQLARDHLRRLFGRELLVRIDADELLDHRSRRPVLVFDEDHWESYEEPSLGVHLLRDASETSFLLLSGPEPDLGWERFIAAVTAVIERLGVRLTVGLHSVPWAVAHTRPIGITAHGRPRELLTTPPVGVGRVQVPAGVGNLLEYRLGQQGRAAIGLVAHTPYYLAHVEYPASAAALLGALERAAGLDLSLDELRARGAEVQAGIDAQVADDEQAQSVIRELESRAQPPSDYGVSLDAQNLPTGEELGAEFERFLAERSRRAGRDDQE
jgi:proteasome assembly chaperone (PAC2) family protein